MIFFCRQNKDPPRGKYVRNESSSAQKKTIWWMCWVVELLLIAGLPCFNFLKVLTASFSNSCTTSQPLQQNMCFGGKFLKLKLKKLNCLGQSFQSDIIWWKKWNNVLRLYMCSIFGWYPFYFIIIWVEEKFWR